MKNKITITSAYRMRYDYGRTLPTDRDYENPEIKQIAIRQKELFDELDNLDKRLKELRLQSIKTEMTDEDALIYASMWGDDSSAGKCMYGFGEEFLVQNEFHRRKCIDWIEDVCKETVKRNPEDYNDQELDKLDVLVEKIKNAKCI